MELPDCPPGAEGYEDTVTEVPRKPDLEEPSCTKAEQEFQEHLNSLKVKLEDGSLRCMVERRGRDVAGKWIYLCYPCAAVCSGESILQTHLSGKKHKTKLSLHDVWSVKIFDEHPFNQTANKTGTANEKGLKRMAEEVDNHNKNVPETESKYDKYKNIICHIQESLDAVKAPLLGVEYLIEHPPEQEHYEPAYMCTLCSKQGHPRTIINHMTCFWHRYNYLLRHFSVACGLLTPYRAQTKYREGVGVIMNRLAQRIEDKYGRKRPVNIEKEEYEKEKDKIHQWIFKAHHFSEKDGCTFAEVVDVGLIDSLHKSNIDSKAKPVKGSDKREPSPPVVAAPSKPLFNSFSEVGPVAEAGEPAVRPRRVRMRPKLRRRMLEAAARLALTAQTPTPLTTCNISTAKPRTSKNTNRPAGRQERRADSVESLSDISDEADVDRRDTAKDAYSAPTRDRRDSLHKPRYEPYPDKRRAASPSRSRYAMRNQSVVSSKLQDKQRPPNYEYKVKLAEEKRLAAEESAKKTLAYHEKNPEKHPLYPEEWKKFWNKRYKEIQSEGKDPAKHDFKPEWILFWTARMKDLHEEELRVQVNEIYRRMCLSPPDCSRRAEPERREPERRELERRDPERREPERRRDERRRDDRREPLPRRREPDFRRERRTPPPARRSPGRLRSSERARSPPRRKHTRSRSPHRRSPARTHIELESLRRSSRSPLSQRDVQPRNRSPEHARQQLAPSMQTVLISDDELKPDDGLSPWNSDNDIESVASGPTAVSLSGRSSRGPGSLSGRSGHSRRPPAPPAPGVTTPPDDVVGTLRQLVALEDYLGSLGPRVVDLLADALTMEKERANSAEQLLERDSALVLLETAKEKLKGAAQAGLVGGSAAAAVRNAVVRVAATLHEADKRAKLKRKEESTSTAAKAVAVPVAGVGEVDRAQIAQQMAEALIAQGKTDVSSEELAQLVEAVVGMAEAKKREAEKTKKTEQRAPVVPAKTAPAKLSGTASALQMLQSAYDENDKKLDKEDIPDAMDGLSDSDLETLLKNFNELSAEEQHSLIAYLKKLEAKEPQRVERLRQYVSDPGAAAPNAEPLPAEGSPEEDTAVVLESDDDDDYTVEEVFQSATQKVKENQIRQEMEIVKKSLEEAEPEHVAQATTTTLESSLADITKNLSSATDLFALVQASIKSTPASTPAPISRSPNVVISSTQPRSFGDLPEVPMVIQETLKPLMQNPPLLSALPPLMQNVPILPTPQMQSLPLAPAPLMQNLPIAPALLMAPIQGQLPQAAFHNQQSGLLRPPVRHQASPQQNQYQQQQQHYQPLMQQQQHHQLQQHQSLLHQAQHQQHQLQQHQQNQQQYQPQQQNQQSQYQPPQQYQHQQPQQNQQQQESFQHNIYNDNRNKPNDNFNQGQWNQRQNNMMDNRGASNRGTGPNTPYNQGPRNNFMNGRGRDDTRQNTNNQFGNYDNNTNNFRGRGGGRGQHGGPIRGRGRGYY